MSAMSNITFRLLRARADRDQALLRRGIDDANRVNQRVAAFLDDLNGQREESRARMSEQDLKDDRERNTVPECPRPRTPVPFGDKEP